MEDLSINYSNLSNILLKLEDLGKLSTHVASYFSKQAFYSSLLYLNV